MDAGAVGPLLCLCQRFYDVVLVDLGPGLLSPASRCALDRSSKVIVVTTPEWPAVSATVAGLAQSAVRGTPRNPMVDEGFHRQLAGASGNDVAEALLGDLNDRIRILRIYDFTTDDRIGSTIEEHLEILACVCARDADAAAAFMRAHVQRSALVVRERVGSALARMFELP